MTQFLLDTNVLLWHFWGSNRIDSIQELIASSDVEMFVSSVSLWEVAIKAKTKKLEVDPNELRAYTIKYSFQELPVTSAYLKAYGELPGLHRDPFDHMLLAQAITCPMRLITADALLAEYSSLVMVI